METLCQCNIKDNADLIALILDADEAKTSFPKCCGLEPLMQAIQAEEAPWNKPGVPEEISFRLSQL